ncbi:MAG: glycerophosphodiester phosphodiesterase family protein [Flavobacteriaceae bacterium]|nr:glycerophosphodiester phosphodiesterase family protein [Bacteroidia bacterium]NNL15552.1 glycerophosphodiester phosphodiesterase family protein [Flavobacteriaceae bacterium]
MKRILLFILLLGLLGCRQSNTIDSTSATTNSKLIEVFKVSNGNFPNISVHRGGKGILNYPENCLETIQYLNDSISAMYEVDVAQTKDGKLVLMHDNSVDRTTTGSGLVSKLTYNELEKFKLIDDYGNITNYKIPLFSEVLERCTENNVILTIDLKRSIDQKTVVKAIREAKAEDISIIITYDVEQAKTAYNLAPDLLLSVSARNNDEFDRLIKAKIPTQNVLAFTGTRLSHLSLYKRLHEENIVCILGTLGNLDRQAKARGDELYKTWQNKGVDIFATDRPIQAFNAIN